MTAPDSDIVQRVKVMPLQPGDLVTGLTVDATSGQLTRMDLKLGLVERIDLKAHDVRVSAGDEDILVALGWATPEAWEKLQDSANELITEVRELRARVLRDRLETLPVERDTVLDKVAEALGKYAPAEVKWSRVLEEVSELAARMEGLEK